MSDKSVDVKHHKRYGLHIRSQRFYWSWLIIHQAFLTFYCCINLVTADFVVEDGETVICHYPDSQDFNSHTIIVNDNAVQSHLDHGDTIGPCEGDCPEEDD